ncbi:unnamed protein product [Symbiodinium microadriaticum]|nr:unnamed protein product [Symbiodinium microadriaticum]CAE7888278.1 unnamed protein product [Symbiodinium sp. KB8]
MARLPSRGKKLAAAAARGAGPASKLQPAKVGKAAALVAPACPPGCAVVSADLLHHLQQEVGIKATAPHEPKYEARHELNSRPEPSKAQARPKRQKDPGSQEVLPLKAAAVLHDEVPPPPGARHAGVGTVQAVEEGTQTSFEENKAGAPPPRPQAVPQAGPLPTSAREGIEMRPTLNVNRHRVDGVAEATPLQHDGMLAPRQAAVAAPAAVAQPQPVETSQNYGRCDPFHLDRITAEKERDRKRVQAQMLAEQIQLVTLWMAPTLCHGWKLLGLQGRPRALHRMWSSLARTQQGMHSHFHWCNSPEAVWFSWCNLGSCGGNQGPEVKTASIHAPLAVRRPVLRIAQLPSGEN